MDEALRLKQLLHARQTLSFHILHLVAFALVFAQSSLAVLSIPVFLRAVPCGITADCQQTMTCSFGLDCDDKRRVAAQTSAFLGSFVANIGFSFVGGRLGRKVAINAAFWSYLLGLLMLMNPQQAFGGLLGGLFLMGGVMSASSNFVFLLINEMFNQVWRQRSCAALMMLWSLGEIFVVPIANALGGWQNYFFCALVLPSVATALCLVFILDSPMFYAERGEYSKAYAALDLPFNTAESFNLLPEAKSTTRFGKQTLIRLTVCSILLMGLQIIYYGTQFAMQQSGLGPETNNVVLGGFQLLGNFGCLLIIPFLPRRSGLAFLYLGSVILAFGAGLLAVPWLVLLLAGIARVFNSFCFTLKSVYIQELFPSNVRAQSAGTILSIGLLAGSLVPGLLAALREAGLAQMTGVAVLGLLCSPVLCFLVETKGLKKARADD